MFDYICNFSRNKKFIFQSDIEKEKKKKKKKGKPKNKTFSFDMLFGTVTTVFYAAKKICNYRLLVKTE